MQDFKLTNTFLRLEARQFNSNRIAVKLDQDKYISGLPENYVSPAGITKDDMIDKVKKFLNCGSIAEISKFSDGKHIVRNANYCGVLGCWTCGSRTERKRYSRIKSKIEQASNNFKYAYHVIFTIKDGANVRERSLFLRESLKRFRKIRGGEYEKVHAGLFSQEIIEGKYSKEYHTHCHAVLWSNDFLDYRIYDPEKKHELIQKYKNKEVPKKELNKIALQTYTDADGETQPASTISMQWLKATRGEGSNIKVIPIVSEKDYKEALKEVIKYATKMNENAPGRVAEIISDCHGMRFFSTVKNLRFDRKNGELPPEPKRREDLPDEVLNIRWNQKQSRYEEFFPSEPIKKDETDKIRKIYQAETALILAEYRKRRSEAFKNPPPGIPLFRVLDNLKAKMRSQVKIVWSRYERLFWQTYKELKIISDLKEAAANSLSLISLEWYAEIDKHPV